MIIETCPCGNQITINPDWRNSETPAAWHPTDPNQVLAEWRTHHTRHQEGRITQLELDVRNLDALLTTRLNRIDPDNRPDNP